jgi:hypothetical protein
MINILAAGAEFCSGCVIRLERQFHGQSDGCNSKYAAQASASSRILKQFASFLKASGFEEELVS